MSLTILTGGFFSSSFRCKTTYIGKTARRLMERMKEHAARDMYIYRDLIEENQPCVSLDIFEILPGMRSAGKF